MSLFQGLILKVKLIKKLVLNAKKICKAEKKKCLISGYEKSGKFQGRSVGNKFYFV